MNNETYEKLMFEEWKRTTLDSYRRLITTDTFDIVYDLRNNLYDIFYPLGISSNRITAVCAVTSELEYAYDGELSIVISYTKENSDDRALRLVNSLTAAGLSATKIEALTKMPEAFNFFVCRGFHSELTHECVEKHACFHRYNHKLVRYVSKDFTKDTLRELHKLIPNFNAEKVALKNNNI